VVKADGGGARPAAADPGAADQPAADDHGGDQRQPQLDHDPAALGAPAQLAILVASRMGRSTGQRQLAWTVRAARGGATSPAMPHAASTCRQVWSS
jgi:hypothetical protein